MAIGDRIGLPDDVSVGYVIGTKYKNHVTVIQIFLNLYHFYNN